MRAVFKYVPAQLRCARADSESNALAQGPTKGCTAASPLVHQGAANSILNLLLTKRPSYVHCWSWKAVQYATCGRHDISGNKTLKSYILGPTGTWKAWFVWLRDSSEKTQ